MSAVSRLALSLLVERLEQSYSSARDEIERRIQREHDLNHTWMEEITREECPWCGSQRADTQMDRNGRYVLLDSLTALVQAQRVLAES